MNLNNTFGTCVSNNRFIDEVGFACGKGRKYGIHLNGRVKAVILSMFFLLAATTLSLTTPIGVDCLNGNNVFNILFHKPNNLSTFAETYQGRGGLQPNPSLELASYLEAYSNFPNLKSYFEAHNIEDFGRFFLTPFQAFQIPLCNPSLITLQRYGFILKKQNKIKLFI